MDITMNKTDMVMGNSISGVRVADFYINPEVKKRILALPHAQPYVDNVWKGFDKADFDFVLVDDGGRIISLKEHFRYIDY
jgi:hypothetical protein